MFLALFTGRRPCKATFSAMNETTRIDMHVHSLGVGALKARVQRSLGITEGATEPAEAYELAKHRGMDVVTLHRP